MNQATGAQMQTKKVLEKNILKLSKGAAYLHKKN